MVAHVHWCASPPAHAGYTPTCHVHWCVPPPAHAGYIDDVYGYDFAGSPSCGGQPNPAEGTGLFPTTHGTHVAGLIAAVLNNNIGGAGVAQVRIMMLKVCRRSPGVVTLFQENLVVSTLYLKQSYITLWE